VFAGPYTGIDPGFFGNSEPPPNVRTDRAIEVGFREDGVVVWRKVLAKAK
jgi:hypothetical protein